MEACIFFGYIYRDRQVQTNKHRSALRGLYCTQALMSKYIKSHTKSTYAVFVQCLALTLGAATARKNKHNHSRLGHESKIASGTVQPCKRANPNILEKNLKYCSDELCTF